MTKHFLYSATATKFKRMHAKGEIDQRLESRYFDQVSPGDVIWIIEVGRTRSAKDLILGRFVVANLTRVGKATQVDATPDSHAKLMEISLAAHRLRLDCVSTAGPIGGICETRWGAYRRFSGAFAGVNRWVRTGWQLTDEAAKRLEAVWIVELSKAGPTTPDKTARDLSSRHVGAGFGDPETNRRVEQSAIDATTAWYETRHWKVESVENEKVGYDLLCRKGSDEEHVEVKGVSGSIKSFIITQGEVECARRDHRFRLVVVTNALSQNPTLSEYSAREFLEKFVLRPCAYRASLISS